MGIRKFLTGFVLLALTALPAHRTTAQEVLVGLQSYPVKPSTSKKSATKSSITLPFFDDFAKSEVYPNPTLWQNHGVITNLNYAISPITIGTATFDAAGSTGELYQHLSVFPQPADALTSQPINLNLPAGDSIYLSFLFQPQGLGYAPSKGDSLVLEFIDTAAQWHRVWVASVNFGDSTLSQTFHLTGKKVKIASNRLNSNFHNVMIAIKDSRYLSPNFQIRFQNYASLSQNQSVPGLISNCDHWMLDLVYINKNRSIADTTFNDIAFSRGISPLMNGYTSVPWRHFNSSAASEFPSPMKFTITYTNLGSNTWNVTRKFQITDHSGHTPSYSFSGGAENIFGKQTVSYTRNFEYTFGSAWSDSAKFTLQSHLITDDNANTLHLRNNDTIYQEMNFYNYYSLDDGSAESGYGLYGDGTSSGMVACKFNNYQADTLRGVMIYFNRTAKNGNETKFKLTVWDDNNGKPGNIIAQRVGVKTLYTNSLNQFTTYKITPTFIAKGTFYVGWVQVYECMMNVGFDLNRTNKDKLLYNIGSGWTNTQFDGTLMIRPIMGNMHQWATGIATPLGSTAQLVLYPNPATSTISIRCSDEQMPSNIQIISSSGRCVMAQWLSSHEVNVENIPNGLYILKAMYKDGTSSIHKFIINR